MAWRVPGFEPIDVIGRGRTGVLMSARDTATGSTVAVKYLSHAAYRALDPNRFRDDALELERLEHPNVAQVYQFVEVPAGAAVITQLVDGIALRRLIDAGGPLDPQAALYVLRSALLGLKEVHGRGIVHRDVKPENLIIDGAGVTKVVDIGVAVRSERGAAAGDPRYQAPELRIGAASTAASDVYAATAVLFECLTGAPPRQATTGFLRRRWSEAILSAPFLSLPNELRTFCRLGLAASPGGRPAGADLLLEQLELVAHSTYGPDWEQAGQAQLARRLASAQLDSGAPHVLSRGALTLSRLAGVASRPAVVMAIGLAVLLGGGTVFVATGALAPADAAPTPTADSHIPVVLPGPTVPVPTSSAPVAVKPLQPTGLHVTGRSQTAVSLDWNPAHDNVQVAGYIVSRDGHRVGTTYDPGFTDTGLTAKTRYAFTVAAFDILGNLSPASPAVFATTLTEPDTAPPSVPTGLHVTGRSTTTIVLAWLASQDNIGVAGYDVFRDGTLIKSVTIPNVTDTGLVAASSHTYAVRAFDTANNASARSPSVVAVTLAAPTPTPTPTATPPPPAATHLSISASPITSPDCTTTVSATVDVSGGPITVDLQYNLPGSSGVQSVPFANSGQQTVTIGVADGTVNGSASVTDPVSGLNASTSWTAPVECVPAPPTTDPPTPTPT